MRFFDLWFEKEFVTAKNFIVNNIIQRLPVFRPAEPAPPVSAAAGGKPGLAPSGPLPVAQP
ncbi:hypothetical protein [Kamptonema formosum]|uniref:hypothetical protein n=1 Tax=Kamptonema formosum TaxID=331992 RepID=UPI00034609A4|nr:hypothetical protein [Oscillatoria sp. PCC 10802]